MQYIHSRKWLITINNPVENGGFAHEIIKDILTHIPSLVYYCMADEIGENGTFHTHLYVCCNTQVTFEEIKGLFPTAHIDLVRGTSTENRNYVFKTNKWSNNPKAETNLHDSHYEWGVMPDDDKKIERLSEMYSMIQEGYTNYEILGRDKKRFLLLNDLWKMRKAVESDRFRVIHHTFVEGLAKIDRTSFILDRHGHDNVYIIRDYERLFDAYNGERVIVFDDFEGQISDEQLRKIMYGFPMKILCDYGEIDAMYTKIYFISDMSLYLRYEHGKLVKSYATPVFVDKIYKIIRFNSNGEREEFDTKTYWDMCQ